MRIIFFGSSEFAIPSLEQLADSKHAIVTCVTQPDRPQGRGLKIEPSLFKKTAQRLGITLSQPERLSANEFESYKADIGVVIAYGVLIKADLLRLFPFGMLGVHPSVLPLYRGAAPVAWAILNGETKTGISIFRLNERLDAGDIFSQRVVDIAPEEDAQSLGGRLAHLGAKELVDAIDSIESGHATFKAQDESQASFAPKLTRKQGYIDWNQPARMIWQMIRATAPWPGATTSLGGSSLKITKASVDESLKLPCEQLPGTIIKLASEALSVVSGAGTLLVSELQPAGKRRMSVKDFVAGHRLKVGDRFESHLHRG